MTNNNDLETAYRHITGNDSSHDMEQSKPSVVRHSGMFKPGVSGNPLGRPKSDVTIRELAKQHTVDALSTLVEIAQNKKAPPSARVHAAVALLDRGWGKPPQYVESVSFGMTYRDFLQGLAELDAAEASLEV
jgi:hypothetical protein